VVQHQSDTLTHKILSEDLVRITIKAYANSGALPCVPSSLAHRLPAQHSVLLWPTVCQQWQSRPRLPMLPLQLSALVTTGQLLAVPVLELLLSCCSSQHVPWHSPSTTDTPPV